MTSRLTIINVPGLGVGDVRNSSPLDHSIEQLLRYAYEKDLNIDLTGLESIGFNAFVKYEGAVARKSSVTARLAARNVYGNDDFSAFTELGGGDEQNLPVFSRFTNRSENGEDDVFLIAIGADETIVPAFEFIHSDVDADVKDNLLDVLSAPLVRNECVIATFADYREAAREANPTFALACLAQVSRMIEEILPTLGTNDGLMLVSTTAIDSTDPNAQFRSELTPLIFHSPAGQIHDLGLRLLSDVGPTIAEFFGIERDGLIGASMGKWMLESMNPQQSEQSQLHS